MIRLERRSLADCQSDLLICGVDERGRVDAGPIGALFQEAGGQFEESLKAGLGNGSRLPGSVVITPSFGLLERGVKSLALVVVRPAPRLEQLRQAIAIIAHQIGEQGWRSLSCPALGCGANLLDPTQAAYAILEGLTPRIRDGLEVELALPRESEYRAFEAVARRLKLRY